MTGKTTAKTTSSEPRAATKPYDPRDFLKPEEVPDFLAAALSTGDLEDLKAAFRVAVRVAGPGEVAKHIGLTRPGLYKAIGPSGNPSYATVSKLAGFFSTQFLLVPTAGVGVRVRLFRPETLEQLVKHARRKGLVGNVGHLLQSSPRRTSAKKGTKSHRQLVDDK